MNSRPRPNELAPGADRTHRPARTNSTTRPNELDDAPERTRLRRRANPPAPAAIAGPGIDLLRISFKDTTLEEIDSVHATKTTVIVERTQRPARTNSTAGANELHPGAGWTAIPGHGAQVHEKGLAISPPAAEILPMSSRTIEPSTMPPSPVPNEPN
jgi:hypothetical protein